MEVAAWIGRCRAVGEAEQQLVNVQTRRKQDQTENFLQFLSKKNSERVILYFGNIKKLIPQMANGKWRGRATASQRSNASQPGSDRKLLAIFDKLFFFKGLYFFVEIFIYFPSLLEG